MVRVRTRIVFFVLIKYIAIRKAYALYPLLFLFQTDRHKLKTNSNIITYEYLKPELILNIWKYNLVLLIFFTSCKKSELDLKTVSYYEFEQFMNETKYITDAEKYGWSIVQIDVYTFKKVNNANWKKPDGINTVTSNKLPVTQVSYNDAVAYCKWAKKRLPTYNEYWEIARNDNRTIISDNKFPISEIDKVNIVGNVWDITEMEKNESVRLAGGSLFCSENTCHGTIKERELFVDKETGNIHIGFSVIEL